MAKKKKKNFVLRVNEETHRAIEKWAADEFRSVNGQIEWMLTQVLRKHGKLKKAKPKEDETEDKKP